MVTSERYARRVLVGAALLAAVTWAVPASHSGAANAERQYVVTVSGMV